MLPSLPSFQTTATPQDISSGISVPQVKQELRGSSQSPNYESIGIDRTHGSSAHTVSVVTKCTLLKMDREKS